MKMYLATGTTDNYLPKMVPFLKTVDKNSNFDKNLLLCVGFPNEIENNSKNIEALYLKREEVKSFSCICIQHGEFLNHPFFDSLEEDDVVCFTDGDILMQRPLSEIEIQTIKNLGDSDVMMQMNGYIGEPLSNEYKKLTPTIPYSELCEKLGGVPETYSVYNGGVIIAKKKAWRILREKYLELFHINDCTFKNIARIQWLISFVVNKYLNPVLMSSLIHTHFHGGPTSDSHFEDDVLYIGNDKCVFTHFCYPVPNFSHLNKNDYFEYQKNFLKKHLV